MYLLTVANSYFPNFFFARQSKVFIVNGLNKGHFNKVFKISFKIRQIVCQANSLLVCKDLQTLSNSV